MVKHNLELSETDFLDANAELCILHAFFGIEGIWAKVRARVRAFWEKYDFFDSKSMLTSLIALENFSWHSWNKYAQKKFNPKGLIVRARAQ